MRLIEVFICLRHNENVRLQMNRKAKDNRNTVTSVGITVRLKKVCAKDTSFWFTLYGESSDGYIEQWAKVEVKREEKRASKRVENLPVGVEISVRPVEGEGKIIAPKDALVPFEKDSVRVKKNGKSSQTEDKVRGANRLGLIFFDG